nr:N-acetylmuramidase/lysin [uncultured Mediterranean phage uvMED]
MYALVEDGSISKIITNPKAMVIGDVRYPAKIFQLWSGSELNAIGIYEVITDSTNKKDEKWYINTNESYSFADNQVTRSWGTATPKAHADSLWTQADSDDGDLPDDKEVGDVKVEGLKTQLIRTLKQQVAGELSKTDWYITRNAEKETAIPSAISTHRDAVRTKQAEMETAITNASDTPALETLYTYTTDSDGVQSRPLGELPTLEI